MMLRLPAIWFQVKIITISMAIPVLGMGQSLSVINKFDLLKKMIAEDAALQLVALNEEVPRLKVDLRYATPNNFTGIRFYPKQQTSTYLRKEPAHALAQVALELEKKGIGIWVWDAYRPYSVTVQFWKLIHDERYVADPSKGSGHNRGIAIDLTLYDLITGTLLEMPTEFDDFSEKAHHGYSHLSEKKISNRELLRDVMERNGFIKFQTEWWHYYWPNSERYDILDIPFNDLNKHLRALKK